MKKDETKIGKNSTQNIKEIYTRRDLIDLCLEYNGNLGFTLKRDLTYNEDEQNLFSNNSKGYKIFLYYDIENKEGIIDSLSQILLKDKVPIDRLGKVFKKIFPGLTIERKSIKKNDKEITVFIYPKHFEIM